MKTGKFIVVIILMTIALAACSSQNPASSNSSQGVLKATTDIGAYVPAATTAPSGSTVDAMALIQEKLQNHHGIDRILNAKHTREEWNATLDRMFKYGANISEDEKKVIIDYLLNR
jgi:hypothetical protein